MTVVSFPALALPPLVPGGAMFRWRADDGTIAPRIPALSRVGMNGIPVALSYTRATTVSDLTDSFGNGSRSVGHHVPIWDPLTETDGRAVVGLRHTDSARWQVTWPHPKPGPMCIYVRFLDRGMFARAGADVGNGCLAIVGGGGFLAHTIRVWVVRSASANVNVQLRIYNDDTDAEDSLRYSIQVAHAGVTDSEVFELLAYYLPNGTGGLLMARNEGAVQTGTRSGPTSLDMGGTWGDGVEPVICIGSTGGSQQALVAFRNVAVFPQPTNTPPDLATIRRLALG